MKSRARWIEWIIAAAVITPIVWVVHLVTIPPPVKLTYWAPLVMDRAVTTRDEAIKAGVTILERGKTYYRWMEYDHAEPGYAGTVHYSLTNGKAVTFGKHQALGIAGKDSKRSFAVTLPSDLPLGTASIRVHIITPVNFLNTASVIGGPWPVTIVRSKKEKALDALLKENRTLQKLIQDRKNY